MGRGSGLSDSLRQLLTELQKYNGTALLEWVNTYCEDHSQSEWVKNPSRGWAYAFKIGVDIVSLA
jgi:hypothetical protein